MSRALKILAFVCVTAAAARAGDTGVRPAHESATLVVTSQAMASFPNGVGGSSHPALVSPPFFSYGNDGVAAPDDWPCWDFGDSQMPRTLSARNLALVSNLASGLAKLKGGGANMVCNWTHFSSNPLFDGHDANSSEALVRQWADAVVGDIADPTRRYQTGHFCDATTFSAYVYRENAANHFLEDNVTLFHKFGNEMCSPQFAAGSQPAKSCRDWIRQELALQAQGVIFCDDEIANNVPTLQQLCSGVVVSNLSQGLAMAACAGIERLVRHHCNLNYAALQCHGPGSEAPGHTYCEGERNPDATGNDWMAAAEASVQTTVANAIANWATTCKQPDAPCTLAACQQWCERSVDNVSASDVAGGVSAQGYCVRSTNDQACTAPHCVCGLEDVNVPEDFNGCGSAGKPCCKVQLQGLSPDGCSGETVCEKTEGVCKACGGQGQPCCSDGCAPGLACSTSSPGQCGGATCQPPSPPDLGAPDACVPMNCQNFVNPDPTKRKCVAGSNPCIPIPGASCGNPPDGCGGTIDCTNLNCASQCAPGQPSQNCCDDFFNCDHPCTAICPSCSTSPVTVTDSCGKPHTCQVIPCPNPAQVCTSGGNCCADTCASLGRACGTWDDGCGGVLTCGPPCCTPNTDCGGQCGDISDGCGGTLHCPQPKTCADYAGICGSLDNGCGGFIQCGCPTGQSCNDTGQCEKVCTILCTQPCVTVSDGCGRTSDCSSLCASQSPNAVCFGGACCTPKSDCTGLCGNQDNGCGGTLACPGCCTPSTDCTDKCGKVDDGCGGTLDCGTCCTPSTDCTDKCGIVDDGCGGELNCGACCTPDTCDDRCGEVPDGCGGVLDCGSCGGGGGGGGGCDPLFESCGCEDPDDPECELLN